MTEQSISCPNCGATIPLTEALTSPIEEKLRKEFEATVKRKDRERENALDALKMELAEKLASERVNLEKMAKEQAEESLSVQMKDLRAQLDEKSEKLAAAREAELKLLAIKRDLEEREQNLKLETARVLDQERAKIREEAATKAADEHRLRDREKDKQLEDMHKQIEELKRKSEQGSQQAQGEVQELELEDLLRASFRFDQFEPVEKGRRGADVLQTVFSGAALPCGTILWESKRTKNWEDKWVPKFKDDLREAKAEIGIIVSTVLPKGVTHIENIDGVWVTDFPSAIGLASALRSGILDVAKARGAVAGKDQKMELLFKYLSGPEFKHRVEAIVESFVTMKEDLDAEKRAMDKIWAKREKQIERVIHNTGGMYGDLQGLIGSSLPQISLLELSPEGEQ